MSKWTKFRDGVTSTLLGIQHKDTIVRGGELANDVNTQVKSIIGSFGVQISNEDIYNHITYALKDKYPELLSNQIFKTSIIELIELNRGLIIDSVTYEKNKDYISIMKKRIATSYIQSLVSIGSRILSYLIEKYILKGMIR